MAVSFRDFHSTNGTVERQLRLRPTWAVINDKTYGGPTEKEAAILKWQNERIDALLQWKDPAIRLARMNRMLYAGKHYWSQEHFYSYPQNNKKKYSKNHAKIVLNYLHQVTENHVSKMSAYEPALKVEPANSEEQDKIAARLNQELIDYYFYIRDYKSAFAHFHRRKKIDGEAFKFCIWNPEAGDLHPSYKKLREMRRGMGVEPDMPVPLVDPETGEELRGDDGNPLFISQPIYQGDIMVIDEFAERVLYPFPESGLWEDVPDVTRLVNMDYDEAVARYPQRAKDLRPDEEYDRTFAGQTLERRSLTAKVCVRYFYSPPTARLPEGAYVVSTRGTILEWGKYPFNHGLLPCVRDTDIDVPGFVQGMSFYQNLASLNQAINNSASMILQNQSLYAYPKYKVPRSARVAAVHLDDDRGMFEFSGNQGPELMVNNSTPSDTWKWTEFLKDSFNTLSFIYAPSQGRGVDGITANVALRMIDEQERLLHKPAIDKQAGVFVQLGKLMLGVSATFRQESDGFMMGVLGKDNQQYLKYFDVLALATPVHIRIKKTSGLPTQPAARAQTVIDYKSYFPNLFTDDEVLEYLDLERPEKLVESGTISRQAAESLVEDILRGAPVPPPSEYHDALPRYRVFEKAVQSRTFDEANPIIKQRMITHIITLEYFIARKMKLNPIYMEQVFKKHPNFPMFFPIGAPPMQPLPNLSPLPLDMGVEGGAPPLGGVPPEFAMDGPSAMLPMSPMEPQSIPEMEGVPSEGEIPQEDSAGANLP